MRGWGWGSVYFSAVDVFLSNGPVRSVVFEVHPKEFVQWLSGVEWDAIVWEVVRTSRGRRWSRSDNGMETAGLWGKKAWGSRSMMPQLAGCVLDRTPAEDPGRLQLDFRAGFQGTRGVPAETVETWG
jgi:hypothetical protein